MENETYIIGKEYQEICEEEISLFEELKAKDGQLSSLLSEVYEVSLEAQRHLHLFDTRPECARLILEDYLKKIEEMCSI